MAAKVIAIVNQKGGVGKTTTAVNFSSILSIMYKKTLLIDIDSQGNASSGLGIVQEARKVTSYDLLTNSSFIEDAIIGTDIPGLDIITSNINMAAIEIELAVKRDHETILKNQIARISEKYDYIVIDCPPSLSILTLNALVACDQVIIPMLCDFYSLEGLSHLLKTVEIIKKRMNPSICISGILFTMYDKRSKLTELVEKDVRNCLGDIVFKTTIPRNVRVAEAPSHGKAVVVYDHKCVGSLSYIELTKEYLARI